MLFWPMVTLRPITTFLGFLKFISGENKLSKYAKMICIVIVSYICDIASQG